MTTTKTRSLLLLLVIALFASLVNVHHCAKYDNIKNLQVGIKHRPETCDRKVKDGDTIKVHYTGKLTNGEEFDSSIPRGEPFSFRVGAGMVIKGWDSGLLGACVGEKRKLVIPSHMGYGEFGSPPKIPGGAVLVFDVEVVSIDE